MKTLPGRIVIDPETCGGKPIFSGARVQPVSSQTVLVDGIDF